VLFGLDLETKLKIEENFDEQAERDALDWIEAVTQEQVDHLWLHLKSGRVLCKMINKIRPGTIKKINKQKIPMLERENIQHFLKGVQAFGVLSSELFSVDELYKATDLNAVLKTIYALERCTSSYSHIPEMSKTFVEKDKEADVKDKEADAKKDKEADVKPKGADVKPKEADVKPKGADVKPKEQLVKLDEKPLDQTTPLMRESQSTGDVQEEKGCCSDCTIF